MAFIPSPGVVQAEIRGTIGESNVENVLYFQTTAPPVTLAAMDNLGQNLDQFWYNRMQSLLPTGYAFREIYLTDQTSATGPAVTVANGVWNGTRPTTQGMMPNNATITISFRTAGRGRSQRGRNYVCGLSRNDVTANTVNQTLLTAIEDAYSELLVGGAFAVAPWLWVVLSRRTNNADRPQGLATTIQRVVVVDAIIDSQRRRLPGRGN